MGTSRLLTAWRRGPVFAGAPVSELCLCPSSPTCLPLRYEKHSDSLGCTCQLQNDLFLAAVLLPSLPPPPLTVCLAPPPGCPQLGGKGRSVLSPLHSAGHSVDTHQITSAGIPDCMNVWISLAPSRRSAHFPDPSGGADTYTSPPRRCVAEPRPLGHTTRFHPGFSVPLPGAQKLSPARQWRAHPPGASTRGLLMLPWGDV